MLWALQLPDDGGNSCHCTLTVLSDRHYCGGSAGTGPDG